MTITLLQIDPTVGDLVGNTRLILGALREAHNQGSVLAVTPSSPLSATCPVICS